MGKEIEKLGRVSTDSVKKCTGRGWREWVTILDKAGAKTWPHREITILLKEKYRLTPWWQQGVAIGYELHHGRRVEGRSEKGLYAMTATKTVPISQKKAWALLESKEGLEAWLRPFAPFAFRKGAVFEVDGVYGEVRTVKAPERMRLGWKEDRWEKASVVQLGVHPRKGEKCMVTIVHEGVPTAAEKEKLRARWKKALETFAAIAASANSAPKSARSR